MRLYDKGLHEKSWRLLNIMYDKVDAYVLHKGHKSEKFNMLQGVGQGRVFSPHLYNQAHNGLLEVLVQSGNGLKVGNTYCGCPTLADDMTLLSASPDGLHKLLTICRHFSSKWRIKFSPDKCWIMVFYGRGQKINSNYKWTYGTVVLEQKTSVTHKRYNCW
jgi:hypothetical protein